MTFQEYEDLKKKIDYHMNLYYNEDSPEITDYDYDQMMLKLKAAEKEHPDWISPDSPSQKIGGSARREAGVKVRHNVPMLSIEDVFSEEEVSEWIDKVKKAHKEASFSVEQKIDGLSMTLRYRKKSDNKLHLELAETRGDGITGEDVTLNALSIPDVKESIDLDFDYLELRGEVYMTHAAFERFNERQMADGEAKSANPRNLAAGTLRQLDPKITRERGLSMFIFNIQSGPQDFMARHDRALDILNEKGLPVVFHRHCSTKEEVLDVIREIGEMRQSLPYDIDGAVVKLDETALRSDFPAGSKYSAGHIAYKYPPEERPVIMKHIEETVGRTGKIGFIGHIEDAETHGPARLNGTNVSRVTLHNADYIKEKKIGIGGIYMLKKSGDIIPKISGIVKEPDHIFEVDMKCPECGHSLLREEETADIRCINPNCPAQISRTISYFASKGCMNIMGLGETLVKSLIQGGYLKNYADIYHLKDKRETLIADKVLGREKNTDKLLKAIEDSKKNDASRLLAGLGIKNVGLRTAESLIDHYGSIDKLKNASISDLLSVQDIGETTASAVYDFFHESDSISVLSDLKASGLNMDSLKKEKGQSLHGLTIVVTGTFNKFSRKEITEFIENNGGKCTGMVSKKTDYLVAGEKSGSKLDKAKALGIKVISEDELMKMVEDY